MLMRAGALGTTGALWKCRDLCHRPQRFGLVIEWCGRAQFVARFLDVREEPAEVCAAPATRVSDSVRWAL
ncbi:hypothetical protein [Streptomyces sp. TE33382]